MSDSPRQPHHLAPPPQSTSHFMDGGLHHRSSRAVTTLTDHRSVPSTANTHINNTHMSNATRPSRLFRLNNPYHGNRQASINSSGGKITISVSRALQCLFLVFIGYVSLLLYTHALWSQHDDDDSNNNSVKNEWKNQHVAAVDGWADSNGHHSSGGGVRSSSSTSGYEEQSRLGIDNNAVDNEDGATSNSSMDQTTIIDEGEDYRIVSLHDLFFRTRRHRKKRKPSKSDETKSQHQPPPSGLQFVFDSSRQQQQQQQHLDIPSNSISKNQIGNQQYLEMAKHKQYERRQNRKRRTTPPPPPPHLASSSTQQQESDDNNAHPIPWYNLDHSSYNTILTNQNRWQDSKEESSNTIDSSSHLLDTTMNLCGKYAQLGASNHPQNYYPPLSSTTATTAQQQQQQQQTHVPLNSQSKVLITGILSPLGFHLTLALHRQCNITNFIGVDSQMPNDPLSRLEMQDRLEVLLDELSSSTTTTTTTAAAAAATTTGKSLWYVPFLGLEPKHSKNEPLWRVEERERREQLLVKIRKFPHQYVVGMDGNDGDKEEDDDVSAVFNTRPYERYGIPLSPGVNTEGYGTLDLIVEYRPTHIVHLAGTQSDSLLNSKRHDRQTNIKEGGGDEESSISSRPHLYELRMGMVGMEQLLSSAVAQTMIPPPSSLESSAAMVASTAVPHVVYASSYDARYYSETSKRLRSSQQKQQQNHHHHRNKEIMLGEEEQITNYRKHHSPPRGFHGVSHLIDEILASTYHGLHGIQPIGLRFDAVYGPHGFGAPSTSVPLLNVNRMRKNVGVSPDVALAEAEVRRMYRKWMKTIDDTYAEEEGDDEISLIEESGWLHASHHPRDFVFVEGKGCGLFHLIWVGIVSLFRPITLHIRYCHLSYLSLHTYRRCWCNHGCDAIQSSEGLPNNIQHWFGRNEYTLSFC